MAGNFGTVNYDPNSFLRGAQAAKAFNEIRAQNMAGSQYGNNPQAAVDTLNAAGMFDQAAKLEDRPIEQAQARTNLALSDQSLQHREQDQQLQNDKAEWAKIGEVTGYLQNIRRNGGDVASSFAQMKPFLNQTLGLDEGSYNAIAEQLASNPGFLDAIHENALKVVGGSLINTDSGEVVFDGTKPAKPQIVKDAQGRPFQVLTDESGQAYYQPLQGGAPTGGNFAPGAGNFTTDTAKGALANLFPNATFTSGARTEAENQRVGGAANSLHKSGQAWDLTFPGAPSTWPSKAQVEAQLRASGFPVTEILGPGDKGHDDHFHIGFGGKAAPAAPAAGFALKPPPAPKSGPITWENMTDAEVADNNLAPGVYQRSSSGQIRPVSGQAQAKAPTQALTDYQTNMSSVALIDDAIKLVDANAEAFGPKTLIPQELLQYVDKKGVNVRAAVQDITSRVRHARSGAAVTAAESPFLAPFLPSPGDSPATVKTKLKRMKEALNSDLKVHEDMYGKPGKLGQSPASPAAGRPSLDDIFGGN